MKRAEDRAAGLPGPRRLVRRLFVSSRAGRRLLFLKHVYFPPPPDKCAEVAWLYGLDLRGRVVFDVGGNIGLMSLLFSRRVGGDGRVLVFEPNARVFRELSHNLAAGNLVNVEAFQVALGAGREDGYLFVPDDNTGHGSLSEGVKDQILRNSSYSVIPASIHALDDFRKVRGLPPPDLVKVDVEGMELDVLKGMGETIDECGPDLFIEIHVVEESDCRGNAGKVADFLWSRGYRIEHVEGGSEVTRDNLGEIVEGHIYASLARGR